MIATVEPQPTTISVVETIDAIDLVALYNDIDSQIPWAHFNATVLYIDKYSRAGAFLVRDIKINLRGAIATRFQIAYEISKFCSSIVPLLDAYNYDLFTAQSVSKKGTRNHQLQLVLNASIGRMESTHFELLTISLHFNEVLVNSTEELTQRFK